MDKVTNIECRGYEKEVIKLFDYMWYDQLDVWGDTPKYEDTELQTRYLVELVKTDLSIKEKWYQKATAYETYDDYFKKLVRYNKENDALYVEVVYEVWDDYEYEEELKTEVYSRDVLKRSEIENLIKDAGIDRYDISGVIDVERCCHKKEGYYIDCNIDFENRINRISYEYVKEKIEGLSRYREITCDTRELVKIIANKSYKENNRFKVFVMYNMLFNLDEFVKYIDNVKERIINARGFIVKYKEEYYRLNYGLCSGYDRENDLSFIDNQKNITLSNINTKILGRLKKYVCDKEVGEVSIREKERFTKIFKKEMDITGRRDRELISLKQPLSFYTSNSWSHHVIGVSEDVIKKYQGKDVSLAKINTVQYEMTISPKVYSPVKKYTVDIYFSYERTPRIQYLLDFGNEELTGSDVENTNIIIHQIKIIDNEYKNIELEEA